jgi:hypothetical protein
MSNLDDDDTLLPTSDYAIATASNPSTNLVVSITWIVIVIIVFGSFKLLFRFIIRPLLKSRPQTTQTYVAPANISETGQGVEMNNANKMHVIHFTDGGEGKAVSNDNAVYEIVPAMNPGDAYAPLKDPIAPGNFTSMPGAPVQSSMRDEGSIAVAETRFHMEGRTQFGYNNIIGSTLHIISVDDDMIRTADIWSGTLQSELLAKKAGALETTLAPNDCKVNTFLAPIEMFTYMQTCAVSSKKNDTENHAPAVQRPPSRFAATMTRFWRLWNAAKNSVESFSSVYQLSPRIAFYSFLVAIIIAFYIPTSMNTGTNTEGKRLTIAVFCFVLVASVFQLVFFRAVWASKTVHFFWKVYAASLWMSMIPALGLVAALLSTVLGGADSHTSNRDPVADAFAAFSCSCPSGGSADTLNNTSTDTTYNGTSTATSHYSFECSSAQVVDGKFQTCSVNCGTCGSTYYGVFVAFASMATIYLLMMLFLLHIHAECYPVIDPDVIEIPQVKRIVTEDVMPVNTHMIVTLHGSKAFGFPITTRLTVRDAFKLEKHLAALVIRNREKGKRDAKYLPHLESTFN